MQSSRFRFACPAHGLTRSLAAILPWLLLAGIAQAGPAPAQRVLHVTVDGNDAWTGANADPAAAPGEGPLASLAGARDRLRALRDSGALEGQGEVHVLIHGGRYALTEPVVFSPADSASEAHPVYFEAAPGEAPLLDGGRVLSDWREEAGRWVCDVPEAKDGRWTFSALWVNGERRTPARTPNVHNAPLAPPADADFFATEGPVEVQNEKGETVKSSRAFRYRENDLQAWDTFPDALVVVYHSWATSLMRPKTLDPDTRTITFTGDARWGFGQWQPDQRYYVSNLFEALDAPGEWYLHRGEGRLYYIPMPGETLENTTIVAPRATQLLVFDGKPEAEQYIDHLHFRRLQFAHTEFTVEPEGHSDAQAAFAVNATIQATGLRHGSFEQCAIAHTGNHGLWFRRGSQNNAVIQCELTDLGAGGVRIGEGGSPLSPGEAADHNTVENCFVHDGGLIFRSAVGVWIGRASYNTVQHNEIADFRYTGVSVGWSWGYAESSANHNVIAYNHIHHIGMGQLNDMGGIYTLGISPGTVLRGNVIHDVMSHPRLYGGWGLYTDEGSTDILLEGNLVYNTTTGGFHQHYGRDNIVRNNIFAYSHGPQIIRSREEDHNSFTFERNIVYFNNGDLLGSSWKNGHWKLDYNCYWDTTGAALDFQGKSLADWQAAGNDAHSIHADPGFADPLAGNFALAPDSPALALGFEPIDPAKAGLQGDPAWVAKAAAVVRPKCEFPEAVTR